MKFPVKRRQAESVLGKWHILLLCNTLYWFLWDCTYDRSLSLSHSVICENYSSHSFWSKDAFFVFHISLHSFDRPALSKARQCIYKYAFLIKEKDKLFVFHENSSFRGEVYSPYLWFSFSFYTSLNYCSAILRESELPQPTHWILQRERERDKEKSREHPKHTCFATEIQWNKRE